MVHERRRHPIVAAISAQRGRLIGLSFVLLVVGWICWSLYRGWTVEQLERRIQAEVPNACDRARVDDWLDQNGIPHFYSEQVASARYDDQSACEFVGLKEIDLSGMTVAELSGKHVRSGPVQYARIRIYFFFDRNGRLAAHWIKRTNHSL